VNITPREHGTEAVLLLNLIVLATEVKGTSELHVGAEKAMLCN
jgi:hypothetical protein